MNFPLIKNTNHGTRFLIFMLLLIFGLVFSGVLGVFVIMINGGAITDIKNLQIIQVLNQIVGFLLPAVVYVMLVHEKPFNYLGFKKLQTWSLLGIVAIFTVIPFLSWVTDWNNSIVFPESMLMHFANNATIVMLYYLNTRDFIDIDVEHFGSTGNVLVIILSLITTVAIFWTCWRLRLKNDN